MTAANRQTQGPSLLAWSEGRQPVGTVLHSSDEPHELSQLASCLIYSYALIEYINRFAVDRMVMFFFTMLPSLKFAEKKVFVFFILREKC